MINSLQQKKNVSKKINLQRVNNTHKQLRDFLVRFNGVSSKYLLNYCNWFMYQRDLKVAEEKLKTWFTAILDSPDAYKLYRAFKKNAVNIRT